VSVKIELRTVLVTLFVSPFNILKITVSW
jgi:hypothetical protein